MPVSTAQRVLSAVLRGLRVRALLTALPAALLTALLTAGLAPTPARAAITCCAQVDATSQSGQSVELVFIAWDMNLAGGPQVSFVKDLGVTMGQFVLSGQQDGGSQPAWWLGGSSDTTWTSFVNTRIAGAALDTSKLQWAVYAFDTTGDFQPGQLNLYTTLTQGAAYLSGVGHDSVINGLSDHGADSLQGATASTIEWLTAVNQTTGHSTQSNGSAVIKVDEGLAFAFRSGGPGTVDGQLTLNGNLLRGIGNPVGKSSWFYGVTGSDPDFADSPLTIDEFDNSAHDGYWGLALSTDPAHAGEYLLSYTLQSVLSPTEQVQNVLFGNSFARLAGTLSLASPAGKAGTVLAMAEGFLRGLSNKSIANTLPHATAASVSGQVSAVPEPAAWALLLAGVGLLAALGRRRRVLG